MKGYFDNAATTLKKPPHMYEAISAFMENNGGSSGRGGYSAAASASALIRETRNLLLELVDANAQKEVIFLPSATIALNTILHGIIDENTKYVYITPFEHNAVTRTLNYLQKKYSFEIIQLSVTSKMEYNLPKIAIQFMNKRPSLIIMSQVSNVFGILCPVSAIARMGKEYDAISVVDAAQACGVMECETSIIDYYVFEGHKTLYGPMGIGGFICNKDTNLKPFIVGGTGIESANQNMPNTIPERFEAGTQNIMSLIGLNFSLKWRREIGQDLIKKQEKSNFNELKRILSCYDFIDLVGLSEYQSSIISCSFKDYSPIEMGSILSQKGISVRTGLHCAPIAHKFLKTFPEGTVRFSISYFTDEQDFVFLDEVLKELKREL